MGVPVDADSQISWPERIRSLQAPYENGHGQLSGLQVDGLLRSTGGLSGRKITEWSKRVNLDSELSARGVRANTEGCRRELLHFISKENKRCAGL